MAKQQNFINSSQISPYNMDMYYSQSPTSGFSFEDSAVYNEQMKKYIDAMKMYPYNFMNTQLNPSFTPGLNANLMSGINPQFGIPMHVINPYIGYQGAPSMNIPYGQLKNTPRTMPPVSIPIGMNPYSNSSGIPSIYSHPYIGSYPQGMMGGYGQPPPPSFSNMMGLEKSDYNSKVS
jgi:hypothetical protein